MKRVPEEIVHYRSHKLVTIGPHNNDAKESAIAGETFPISTTLKCFASMPSNIAIGLELHDQAEKHTPQGRAEVLKKHCAYSKLRC